MRNVERIIPIIFLTILTGCLKEYSYERRPVTVDTTGNPNPPVVSYDFPACSVCNTITNTELSTWNFKIENTKVCGKVDTAIVIADRTAFTLFGPSSCSNDTGMVITVYLQNDTLNRNIPYMDLNKISFYFYDRVTPSYICMSQAYTPFSGSLQNYDHQTKIATGTFSGFALRSDGHWANINSGKFKVKLL
jgi:hypothetical protein